MSWFARGSLRHRLAVVTVGSSALALLVASSALLAFDVAHDRKHAVENLHLLADIAGDDAAAALAAGDRVAAREWIERLGGRPLVRRVALYAADGTPFAAYEGDAAGPREIWQVPPSDTTQIGDMVVAVNRSLTADGRPVGTLVIEQSLAGLYAQLSAKLALLLGVLAACCTLLFWIGSRLVGGVTSPILELARLSHEIAATQDYTRRAEVPEGDGEFGVLARTFNAMLERLERDTDLHAQREQLRFMNAELEREKDRALVAVRTRSEFLANMSHEIRTPMTAILGYIELLRTEQADREQIASMLEVIQRNGSHLMAVINDILDLSKLESGRLEIESVWCSPQEIIADVRQLMEERAAAKGLRFEMIYRGRLPVQIRSDPTRLRQILLNLLSNAIKFTTEGYVRLAVWLSDMESALSARLVFEVTDTGIGIATDKHATIFSAFGQADSSMTRRFGGSGLGLSISSRLAALLGGNLDLMGSALGRGSIFALAVPLGAELAELELREVPGGLAERRTAARPAEPELQLSGRILLAEDSPDTQRLVRMFLRRSGVQIAVAENGALALDELRSARDAGEPYDLVLMDMQMPELDGYSATRALRAEGFAIPVIAFTAHAMIEERERCLAAGCDEFASKPIQRDALVRLVAGFLKVPTSPS
jgi:signal transduction histidine kinase/ActR/RegA family two-component response regulator